MRIALVGFMGTGKTSTGYLLAERLGLDFIDTDCLIEDKAGLSIPEIFSRYGEAYFRSLETEVLQKVIREKDEIVLATGGGIVISPKNRELLQRYTFSVLLQASPAEIYKRIAGGDRPLLFTSNPLQRIKNLLKERKPYYLQFKHKIDTDGSSPFEIVDEIIAMIGDDINERT